MAYTTTTTTGYGKRLGGSIKGIGSGFVFLILGTVLLWWNEGRAVKNSDMLQEVRKEVVHVDNVQSVDPNLNGQLIHASAATQTEDVLTDDDFGISVTAVKLQRDVEYYQYVENSSSTSKDKLGGSEETTTTYTYKKEWCNSPQDSEEFEDPAYKGKNSTLVQFEDLTVNAKKVSFGGYELSEELIASMGGYVDATATMSDSLAQVWNQQIVEQTHDTLQYVHAKKNVVYFGKNPNSPEIGDVRVTFKQVNPGMTSLIAQVNENTFESYVAENGKQFCSISSGKVSVEKMLASRESSNNTWLWLLRIAGILMVCGGLKGIFSILFMLLKVVPFLADIMEFGVGLICTVVGVVWSVVVIALAWIFYRPLLAISLLVACAVVIGFFAWRGHSKKKANANL